MRYKGIETSDHRYQSNLFAERFSSIYKSPTTLSSPHDTPNALTKIQNFENSENLIKTICNNLDITETREPDELPPILFKNRSQGLDHSLKQLFIKIKQTGVFPKQWKTAVITPIHKKGDKSDIRNYRPVSLLNIISKIFERCIFLTLYEHITSYTYRRPIRVPTKKISPTPTHCLSEQNLRIHRKMQVS